MPSIAVCSLALLEQEIARLKPWGIVSLLSPGSMIDTPPGIDRKNHLPVEIHDITEAIDGHTHPMRAHAAMLIDFARRWDTGRPLLVHCWAGVSRSTASAFIIACTHNPDIAETEIACQIRSRSPTATPNAMLVSHADQLLERDGRMVDAVAAIGRGEDCWEGVPFALPARWPAGSPAR